MRRVGLLKSATASTGVVLDFTTQDVLTFKTRQNSYTGYGWVSGSGYTSVVQNASYYRTNTVWELPSTAYGGTLNMIKLEFDVPNLYSGGGLTTNATSSANYYGLGLGAWDSNSTNKMIIWHNYSNYNYSTGIQTLVIDLENAEMYIDGSNETAVSISSTYVTNIRNAWDNETLYLNIVANQAGATTYLRKAEFQTS